MKDSTPVQQSNAMVRLLTGEKLKFTAAIFKKDGSVIEVQTNSRIKVQWEGESRQCWLVIFPQDEYSSHLVCPEASVSHIITEENPK